MSHRSRKGTEAVTTNSNRSVTTAKERPADGALDETPLAPRHQRRQPRHSHGSGSGSGRRLSFSSPDSGTASERTHHLGGAMTQRGMPMVSGHRLESGRRAPPSSAVLGSRMDLQKLVIDVTAEGSSRGHDTLPDRSHRGSASNSFGRSPVSPSYDHLNDHIPVQLRLNQQQGGKGKGIRSISNRKGSADSLHGSPRQAASFPLIEKHRQRAAIDVQNHQQHQPRPSQPQKSKQKLRRRSQRQSLPHILGVPNTRTRRTSLPERGKYLKYSDIKPLHRRATISKYAKRVAPEKVFSLIKREPSGAIVIRVGGGYVVVSDEWDAFFSHGEIGRGVDNADYVPEGVKVLKQLDDGTLVLEDGTKICPDGTRVFADGTLLRPDGTWVDADGNAITDTKRLAELNKQHASAVATSRAASRRNSLSMMMDRRRPVLRKRSSSISTDDGEGADAARFDSADAGRHSDPSLALNPDDGEGTNNRSGDLRKLLGLAPEEGWDFDHEVVDVLPDGSRVLADGTVINADGTITLADGTKLSKDEARALMERRKKKQWPKKLRKKKKDGQNSDDDGDDMDDGSGRRRGLGDGASYADGTSVLASHKDSTKVSRHHSRRGSNVKLGIDADDDDGEYFVDKFGNKQRRLGFPSRDPYGFLHEGVLEHMKPCNGVCALDYLSRYCILLPEQLSRYRQVFDSLDSDGDGEISKVELEFGIKTVNTHFISSREIEYVDVVLDIQLARSINFRMFALISALSERVTGLDTFVRGLINSMDARALAKKIVGCKDLFYILDEQKRGVVCVDDMSNELVAGRISKEHEEIIIDKFTENGKDEVGFLDFLTYIPLFLEIHDTINHNPFETTRDK